MLRVSRRYHWHHYQSLFFSIRNGSAFFVMSFRYATRLKLCLLLINWGFVDPWKNLSAEIMHVLSFFLSFDINWDHIQRRRCPFRQYFENLFSVIYAINRFSHLAQCHRGEWYTCDKTLCARYIRLFFPCIWRITDMKRISRLYIFILLNSSD